MKITQSQEFISTCLQGYVDDGVTYGDLVRIFGDPHRNGDGDKTDAEWEFDVDGEPATIYNYKTGKAYDPDGSEVSDLVGDDWHIGGNSQTVVDKINQYIEESI